MFGFVVFSCVMVLACVAGLLGPLAGKTAASRHESGSFNVDIAREKLEELERQLEAGEISSDEYEALHQDTHATLIEDAGDMHHSENRQGDSFAISVTLAAAIPVISLLLYLALGSPEGVDYQPTVTQQTADGQDVDTLLGNLEQKLAANPDDATGWALLGRSYMSLQRYAKAHQAFSNLRRIQGDTPDILLQLADAETMMNGGIFTIASRSNVFTALEVEPDNVQASLPLDGGHELYTGRESSSRYSALGKTRGTTNRSARATGPGTKLAGGSPRRDRYRSTAR